MNAIINITGNLTNECGAQVFNEIRCANMQSDVERIVLLISSGGGSTDIITPIWEIVEMCDKPVIAIGSTAAALFMMAKTRILMPNTEFLLHKSAANLGGRFMANDLQRVVKENENATRILLKPILTNSILPESILIEKIGNCDDWRLTEEEIEKYGIITQAYNREDVKKYLMG